ncbi:hypothetical protein [Planotetraspora mira]|uniref:MFS transporter n=1 Tax=Planotetraspora mira TaxID=58121 RepID=A0A8J3TVP2_9ACTN|nr:hypothetical protein [Planotetraspora mira]GII32941.1 hypothetical protein Pmi06nite_63830 [Planotetraspora mira]
MALSLGVPAGTFLGQTLGWRMALLAMTALTVVLLLWIFAAVPDYPGQDRGERPKMLGALRVPGVAPVLFVAERPLLPAYAAHGFRAVRDPAKTVSDRYRATASSTWRVPL